MRERMAVELAGYVTAALNRDEAAIRELRTHTRLNARGLHALSTQSDVVFQICIRKCFDNFVRDLHVQAQKLYDSDDYCCVKWINFLPSFQIKYGVSAFRIVPYIQTMENLDTLKSLYSYFYALHFDTHVHEKCYEKWSKLFPNKAKAVRELDLQLSTFDSYEDMI